MNMKKKNNQEIDLIDIYFILHKNLLKIILITVIPTILSIIYIFNQNPNQIKFNINTQIEPISVFNVSEYRSYNSYVKRYLMYGKLNENNLSQNFQQSSGNEKLILNEVLKLNDENLIINKQTLLNLFIDKIKERAIFIEGIKKFGLIKREDFISQQDYENAAKSFANKIVINKSEKKNNIWNIQFQISDLNKLDLFLLFVEEKANEEVRKYLNETFDKLILNVERLNKYEIEDLDIEISNSKDDLELQKKLLKDKKLITENKHTQRLKNLFESTPILDSSKFFAANILTHSTKTTNVTKKNKSSKIVFIIAIISFILGIIFVIISNSIKKRAI